MLSISACHLLAVATLSAEGRQWNEKQAGGISKKSHQSESKRDKLKIIRAGQKYKSCLLSGCVVFHAGERGEECTHRE